MNRIEESLNELVFLIASMAGLFTWINKKSIGLGITIVVFILVLYTILLILYNLIKVQQLKKTGMNEIDMMTGHDFEQYLYYLYKRKGYKVRKTKAVGDFGADLILFNPKEREKIVVQAKRYKRNVGIKAVQEVIGSIKHYDADYGWVVTNSRFTQSAIELAKSNNIRMVNRDNLIRIIEKNNKHY